VLQYPVVLFGAFLAGLTVVNVNPLYTARELRYQLLDSGAHAIVVLENFAHTVAEVLDECALRAVITTKIGDLLSPPMSYVTNFVVKYIKRMVPQWTIPRATALRDVLCMRRSSDLQEVDLGPDDIAFVQYTSGTTGTPKVAVLTHRNVVGCGRQNNLWSGSVVKDGEETVVTPLPLYHVLSLMVNLLSYFNFGGHNILITNPRDVRGLIKELKKGKFARHTRRLDYVPPN
jgi:long-chain acyl-CoA synthetase